MEKYCNGGDLPEVIRDGDMIYFESYQWYKNLEEDELKDKALISKAIFEGSKGIDDEPSDNARTHYSPSDEWEDFEHANHIRANSNYNSYLDVSCIFNDHIRTNKDEIIQDKKELNNDEDDEIKYLSDYLVRDDAPFINEKKRKLRKEGVNYLKFLTQNNQRAKLKGSRNPKQAPVARKCSYKEFMTYQPFNFKGSKGAVGLICWFERIESVFSRSNYTEDCKVKFANGTLTEEALSWWNSFTQPIGIEKAYKIT
uniref:Reverse transcriptase domain-containing protein n=1 Tax=Tanacetum cinerariifolium TaxID=118510 RepID=A0A6L2M5I9_TANCI|nr:reverse transcriptase domain-containing protein [Tanacetum cinerariifolium]